MYLVVHFVCRQDECLTLRIRKLAKSKLALCHVEDCQEVFQVQKPCVNSASFMNHEHGIHRVQTCRYAPICGKYVNYMGFTPSRVFTNRIFYSSAYNGVILHKVLYSRKSYFVGVFAQTCNKGITIDVQCM